MMAILPIADLDDALQVLRQRGHPVDQATWLYYKAIRKPIPVGFTLKRSPPNAFAIATTIYKYVVHAAPVRFTTKLNTTPVFAEHEDGND